MSSHAPPASVWMDCTVVCMAVRVMRRSGLQLRLCVYGQRNVNQGVICLSEEQSARGTDPPIRMHICVRQHAMLWMPSTGARWCRDGNKVGRQSLVSMGLFWGEWVLGGILNRNVDALVGKHMCSACI